MSMHIDTQDIAYRHHHALRSGFGTVVSGNNQGALTWI